MGKTPHSMFGRIWQWLWGHPIPTLVTILVFLTVILGFIFVRGNRDNEMQGSKFKHLPTSDFKDSRYLIENRTPIYHTLMFLIPKNSQFTPEALLVLGGETNDMLKALYLTYNPNVNCIDFHGDFKRIKQLYNIYETRRLHLKEVESLGIKQYSSRFAVVMRDKDGRKTLVKSIQLFDYCNEVEP